MNPEELRNLIECYQPSSDELADEAFAALDEAADQDPEVREQLKSVQAWDAAISEAMHDVPVPEGLEDRLLQSVAQGSAGTAARWNRWPARLSVAAVAAAALIAIVMHFGPWNDQLTAVQVAQDARDWIKELDDGWERGLEPPHHKYNHPGLKFPRLDGWQEFAALDDEHAIAFHATVPPARSRAWLLVIKSSKGRLLPAQPPAMPISTTGNLCIGVWKTGDHIYVLAVNGSRSTYRRVLRTHSIARLDMLMPTDEAAFPFSWGPGSIAANVSFGQSSPRHL